MTNQKGKIERKKEMWKKSSNENNVSILEKRISLFKRCS